MSMQVWQMRQAQASAVAASLHLIGAPITIESDRLALAAEIQAATGCSADQALDEAELTQGELLDWADGWNTDAVAAWATRMQEVYRGR